MFKLSPEIQEKFNRMRAVEDGYKTVFANLSDADLANSAKFWMQHCEAPRRHDPGEPVYDSTFWHIILPELLRRLER